MSFRRWKHRVQDILQAIQAVSEDTQEITFEQFQKNLTRVRSVAFSFMIIGEAAHHIPDEVVARHPDLPWGKMYRMRNLLVHGYWMLDPEVVWETVQNDLPPLIPLLQRILEEDESG